MFWSMIRKDLRRNRATTAALAIFLILSTLLMAGGLRVTGTILSSLTGLNTVAMPPAYLQMHKGDYDTQAFADFVESHDYIKAAQAVPMLDIKNMNIVYAGESLEAFLMDNGFVTQNETFDYLLDMDNEIAAVQKGEIGVPVYYAEELGIQVGDLLTLREGGYEKEFAVSTLIRDATMNAALTSSKRFLIHPEDREELQQQMGDWEYSFEFLLAEGATTAELEKDYRDAGMPANGVAVPGSLLALLNNLSFGLVAFLIIAISVLLMLMAMLCLSYIIQATLAEESQTIAEMKAIGFPRRAIAKLYQTKYIALVLVAGVVGYFAAIPFGDFFSASVVFYSGEGTAGWMKWLFPLVGVILLSLLVMAGTRWTIRKNLKSTVVELKQGGTQKRKEGHYALPRHGLRYPNLAIALGELKCKWKEHVVLFFVFAFASFLILLPLNMKHTVEDPSFITYMGVGESDIRIDIPYSERLLEERDAAVAYLEKDADIEQYGLYRYGYVESQKAQGEWEYLRVSNGDETLFPLEYLAGKAPSGKQDIALSYLNAQEMEAGIGDSLMIAHAGEEQAYTVSGIYQDITYGGKTAKAAIDFAAEEIDVYIFYLDVRAGVSIAAKTDELRSVLTASKVTPIREFVTQTLGSITANIGLLETASLLIALLLIFLITVMILQLTTAREHSAIAVKKAVGMSNQDIRMQLGMRIFAVQCLAILVGTVLANEWGERIFGMILASMGAAQITLLVDPLRSYLLLPAIQLLVALLSVWLGTKVVQRYHIRDQIME